jgi:hypothetical protein
MKRAIFFVLLISISLHSLSQNLVINPGFETWDVSNKPTGWTTAQNCLKDSIQFNSGTFSCRHDGTSGTTKYLGQTFAVAAGKSYRFSFFYKTVTTGSGNGCRIWCYWKDSGGTNLADPVTDAILRPSKYLKSDIWGESSIIIKAPAEAASFYLEVRTYPNSIAFWDDFIFEETLSTFNSGKFISSIEIYPDPSHDYLFINDIKGVKYIDIQNLKGTVLWSSEFGEGEKIIIPVSGLTNGLYILRIISEGNTLISKFIKI